MIDLHTHSTASDGSLSPAQLVQQAAAAGLSTLALTDHDTVKGLAEAESMAKQSEVRLIMGIELSVTWNNHGLHIVALGIDPSNTALKQATEEALQMRHWRAEQMGLRLEKVGIEGAYEGAKALAPSALIGRSHFAQFLINNGHAKDFRQVFKRFLVPGKPGYVSMQWMDLNNSIDLIHQAGGVAVIAHPARYKLTRTKLRKLLSSFADLGGEAIEVVSGSHNAQEISQMANHAHDFGLYASSGSDFHGPDKPWIKLGRLPALPPHCKAVWDLPALQTT